MKATHIDIGKITIGNDLPLVLIAGPCQLESRNHAMEIAEALSYIAEGMNMGFIFKTSFDKANRSSIESKRGIGIKQALPIFDEIRSNFGCPVVTDVHSEDQCQLVAEHVDILQIPAFLCRQTDLLIAAAKTGKVVKVKKGQFLAPWDIKNIVAKLEHAGSSKIILTDRGTSFGYNALVSDMRALPIMAQNNYPVVFDATHSVQQPGGLDGASGGQREFVPTLARAAVATAAIAAIYIETHPDPDNAPSDGPCMIHLKDMPKLISELQQIDNLVKSFS